MNLSGVMARILRGGWGTTLLLYLAVLSALFWGVFLPDQTLFSNDGPLAQLMAKCHALPTRFFGCWADLNTVGLNSGAAPLGITFGLQWLLGPLWFSKFYALISLWLLGIGAWCFFRELRLTPLACLLGGLAVMLNSTCFSVACWGVAAHDIAISMTFFAMAALARSPSGQTILRVVLAGFAVGIAVVDGADVGAIFSLLVAAFALYQIWTNEGSRVKNLAVGLGRLTLVVVCAAFLAAEAINGLVSGSIEGVKGTSQDAETKAQRWNWATQWSLPKSEILSLVVPGLFGYRMDTLHGGNYWGMMGRDIAWEKFLANGSVGNPPTTFIRYTGGGNYAGILVAMVGLWAAGESMRRKSSIFSVANRKWLWFWLGIASLSLMLALGRYAPFYRWFYMLPYVSTIRNPTKFLYLFGVGFGVLFAYGVDGLERKFMPATTAPGASRWPGFAAWRRDSSKFDRYWIYGSVLLVVASLFAWFEYASHRQDLVDYLQMVRIINLAEADADFSIRQVGWFVLFLSLAVALLALIFSGAFKGRRSLWGGSFLGLLLVADLGFANLPWIVYWNYPDKYASNPVIDVLRDKPYEHRVVIAPVHMQPRQMVFRKLYQIEWLQQQFPYYNIQSFDAVDISRMPLDLAAFQKMFAQTETSNAIAPIVRAWQLTNTRYIFGPADLDLFWNADQSLIQAPLKVVGRFEVARKPGVLVATGPDSFTAYPADNGQFGLFELPTALPRAKLYQHWQTNLDNPAALKQIFAPQFDPQTSVVVGSDLPLGAAPASPTNNPSSAVDIASYAPKDILLQADAPAPSILLLNNHFDPGWKVFVDGKPQKLLRCNFLMQGVYLQAGNHQVEFKFLPPTRLLYVSLTAIVIAFLALGTLIFLACKNRPLPPAQVVPPPQSQNLPKPRKADPNPKKKRNQPVNGKIKPA